MSDEGRPASDATRTPPGRRAVWIARAAGFVVPCVVLGVFLLLRNAPAESGTHALATAVGVAAIAASVAIALLAVRRAARAARAAREDAT